VTDSDAAHRELRLDHLSAPEVEAAIAGGYERVVVPMGATEQHGPHLPIGTDAMIADALGQRLAARLENALVAPTIRPGFSPHHLAFSGTISVSEGVLTALLESYVSSLVTHGFRKVIVFSSHAGNYPLLQRWAAPKAALVVDDIAGYLAAMLRPARAIGRDDTSTPHADLSETSQMLALHPALVGMDEALAGHVGVTDMQTVLAGLHSISPNGVLGNPLGASPALGRHVLKSLEDFLVQAVQHNEAIR
jgi:creatinine amidohydrolase